MTNDANRECKACGAFKPDPNAACSFCGTATPSAETQGSEREAIARFCEERAEQYESSDDVRQQGHGRGLREAAIVARTLPVSRPAAPAPVAGDVREALALWLCEEVEWPDPYVGYAWPLHDRDDGYRGEGAYVRLQPKDIVERFREIAERMIARFAALTAGAEPRATEAEWPKAWSGPCAVGNMIANLRTLPPEMPLYTAYHIPMDDGPSLLKVKRPTLSRERVEGTNIKTGDESVPYSAVIWTQPRDPAEVHPPKPDSRLSVAVEALKEIKDADPHHVSAPIAATALRQIGSTEKGEGA